MSIGSQKGPTESLLIALRRASLRSNARQVGTTALTRSYPDNCYDCPAIRSKVDLKGAFTSAEHRQQDDHDCGHRDGADGRARPCFNCVDLDLTIGHASRFHDSSYVRPDCPGVWRRQGSLRLHISGRPALSHSCSNLRETSARPNADKAPTPSSRAEDETSLRPPDEAPPRGPGPVRAPCES